MEQQPGTRAYYEEMFSQAHLWPVEWQRACEDVARLMVENEKDGSLLLLVPEGEFLAGGPGSNEGGGAPFPVHLPAYYLALHPVTNAQYATFLNAVRASEADLKKWIDLDMFSFERAQRGRRVRSVRRQGCPSRRVCLVVRRGGLQHLGGAAPADGA